MEFFQGDEAIFVLVPAREREEYGTVNKHRRTYTIETIEFRSKIIRGSFACRHGTFESVETMKSEKKKNLEEKFVVFHRTRYLQRS